MRNTTPVPAGHRRRMSDGKNAWRKMTQEQRVEFLRWIYVEENDCLIEELTLTSHGKKLMREPLP